jgi:hypothetical protein
MGLIILIPAVACWAVLALGSVRKAFLNAYLPALLLLPQYYILRLPHLPPLTFSDAALLPLAVALVATEMRRWRLAWMDLWVLLFAACAGLSQGLSTELANGDWVRLFTADAATSHRLNTNLADGALMFIAGLFTMVLPYMLGKLLIESDNGEGEPMRKQMVQRIAALLAIVALVSVYDFLTGRSLWQRVGSHVFPNQYVAWTPQMRWGFGRIAGPYGHAILAGMIFLMGLVYVLWLCRVDPGWGTRRVVSGLPFTERGLLLGGVAAGLLMTQSRGPWVGVGLALIFALLTRMFSVGKAAVVFLVLMAVLSAAAYHFGRQYTEKEITQAGSEEQQSAIYRRQLLTNYAPLVMERKAFGWGITTFPSVMGMRSIDNQYLLLAVTQGLVGMGLFLAIAAGTAARLLRMISRPLLAEDRLLVFAHLAVLIGLMTTFATVYMGEQVVMMFFLFTGWVQGMRPAWVSAGAMDRFAPQFGFRRVLI